MFGKKTRRIAELEARVRELEYKLQTTTATTEELAKATKLVETLKALRTEDITRVRLLTAENADLKSKLEANRAINATLKSNNNVLTKKVEHTKKVNRERQRRFREAHKAE